MPSEFVDFGSDQELTRLETETFGTEDEPMLSGMRPSGPLHLGHFAGALTQWKTRQDRGESIFCLVADYQAGTTHSEDPKMVREACSEVVKDWIACGLDPTLPNVHFVLQSALPELHEMTALFAQVAPVSWNDDIPTIREEREKQIEKGKPVTMSFYNYVLSQLADIMMVRNLAKKVINVPVGADQVSILRNNNQVARRFTTIYGVKFPYIKSFLSENARLPALQGDGKMSKSEGDGSIFLKDTEVLLRAKVSMIETDPARTHKHIPGNPDKNRAFAYLDAFAQDPTEVVRLRAGYRDASVGDREVKDYLFEVLNETLKPIREARAQVTTGDVQRVLHDGTEFIRPYLRAAVEEMRNAMAFNFLDVSPEEIDSGNDYS